MKQVIMIPSLTEEKEEKPVEFTNYISTTGGAVETSKKPSEFEKVVYLGKCRSDGDMFAAYTCCGRILIYKGHLNSRKY